MQRPAYLVGHEPSAVWLSAGDVLRAFEDGLLDAQAPIRLFPNQSPRPLRRLLKELVLEANESSGPPIAPHEPSVHFQTAFEHCPHGMVLTDFLGRLTQVNPAFAAMLGSSADALLGQSVRALTHPEDQHLDTQHANAMLSGRCRSYCLEKRFVRADGTVVPTSILVTLVHDHLKKPVAVLGYITDATAQHDQLVRLRRADRFETLGRLVGSVAHDLNNLVMVIQAATLFIELQSGANENLDSINDATAACVRLTRQLLDFLRSATASTQDIVVNDVVHGFERLLRRLVPDAVRLQLQIASDALVVRASPAQVEQVLLNLVTNACQAMPQGGDLQVTLHRVDTAQGPMADLSVRDTGVGMEPEMQGRIFEPFFTTRGASGGTGIGLSGVADVMNSVGGLVDVESQLGEGTHIRTHWPLSLMPMTRPSTVQPEDSVVTVTPRRILLVEDDAAVRSAIHKILQQAGHTVISAASGESALAWLSTHDEPIDLLVTDLVLAGMSGDELRAVVHANFAQVAVLFMTCYAAPMVEYSDVDTATTALISKPFHPRRLLHEIERLTTPADTDVP